MGSHSSHWLLFAMLCQLRLPTSKRCMIQTRMTCARAGRVCLPASKLEACSAATVRLQHACQPKRQGPTPQRSQSTELITACKGTDRSLAMLPSPHTD